MNMCKMRKIRLLIIVVFSFSIFSSVYAAETENINSENNLNLLGLTKSSANKVKATVLGLGANDDLLLISSKRDKNGNIHERHKQTYRGIPIWGSEIIFHHDGNGNVKKVTGRLFKGLDIDFSSPVNSAPKVKIKEAMLLFKKERNKKYSALRESEVKYSNENIELNIYVDDGGKPRLVYFLSYYSDNEIQGSPTRPHAIIDADTNQTINEWEGLAYYDYLVNASGPGGNIKTGKKDYWDIPISWNLGWTSGVCFMDTTWSSTVKTINLNNRTSAATASDQPFSYNCYTPADPFTNINTYKEINGAYSPINDAHRNATLVYLMYQELLGYREGPFGVNTYITVGVHMGSSYENAFWNGVSVNFGDGANTFYPLVSLDIVSHEIAHGFTERYSHLAYYGQSGGINESFSDMAGEAAEFYVNGYNDWNVGFEITKSTFNPLRYMNNPPLDGHSIDNFSSYAEGLDVHYSSGIFNKAFYLLSTKAGWNTRKAFEVMVHANQYYWTALSNFNDAACGAIDSATDLAYSASDVYDSFNLVGVDCATYTPPGPVPPPSQQSPAWLPPIINLILE